MTVFAGENAMDTGQATTGGADAVAGGWAFGQNGRSFGDSFAQNSRPDATR